ncbi:hypothetical protein [Bosea vaviloviae]|uniref:Uncharacterized protein n=1 Tax=Bosea vaviloviae TaxID=1526658 RepID=A0A1D7U2L4_9HYPH|nr:hypothetical protein [Bosea vaviloviae]AOO81614.1 hypothetical protein BHK69_15160 [Bosea vaviloviae]
MPFRSIVATPEELAEIVDAFEKAWREIEARDTIPPLSVPAERERLGYIVAGLWNANTPEQLAELAELAVRHFDATAVQIAVLANIAQPPDP